MKKAYLSIVFFLLFIQVKAHQNECIFSGGPKYNLTIIWGSIPTCTGWGICGVIVETSVLSSTIQAESSGESGEGYWKLSIPRQNLVRYYPEFLIMFDGKTTVTFPETYTMPEDVKNTLGVVKDLTILRNIPYPMKYENGEFIISFPF